LTLPGGFAGGLVVDIVVNAFVQAKYRRGKKNPLVLRMAWK